MTYNLLLPLLITLTPTPQVWGLCDLIDAELRLGVELELITEDERSEVYNRCLVKHG